jgi:hypothetical protein
MMNTQLDMESDVRGNCAYAPQFSNTNYNTTLSANAEQHFTVPSTNSKWIAIFSFEPGASVWVSNSDTAATPSSSFATSLSQLNPSARTVYAGEVLSFISPNTTAEIGVSLYAISQ